MSKSSDKSPIPDPEEGFDWIESLVRLASRFGFSEIRTRWKLMAWRDSIINSKTRLERNVEHANYEHKVCPDCGKVNDRENSRCYGCQALLPSQQVQFISRLAGLGSQRFGAAGILSLALLLTYAKSFQLSGDLFSVPVDVGLSLGIITQKLVFLGEWQRFFTFAFVHWGIMHLAFNVFALFYITPKIESIFGRGKALFFFLGFGALVNLTLYRLHIDLVSAGSSVALFGFLGLGIGWGQRASDFEGRMIRDEFLKLGIFWLILNQYFGNDILASTMGLAWGVFLGFGMPESWYERKGTDNLDFAMSVIAGLWILGALFKILMVSI